MNQLAKLQNIFQTAVLQPEKSLSPKWVSATGRVSPEIQLSVYSYAYHARLIEVLVNDYPAILMAIGDEVFERIANNYIAEHPSHYFSLRDFGSGFANFILTNNPQQEMYWLYELASFEWHLVQAFDAADASLFTVNDMGSIAAEQWPEVKFILHPSVQRLNFIWNAVEMWQVLSADEPSKVIPQMESENTWLVWREQLTTRFRSLNKDEQLAFETLQSGGSFSNICENLVTLIDEESVPMHAASLLKGWISQGLIHKVKY